MPGVDPVKAELVRRDVAQRILDRSGDAGDVPLGWRRWANTVLTPKVDYMATIRHAVRKALRDSTLGRYDRTYRRPHRRQACVRRVHHVVIPPAAAAARVSDRHLELDAGHAAGESRRRTRRADASARLRHRCRRGLLRRRRARREESVQRRRRWSCTAAAARTSAPACAGSPSARAARSICWSSSPTARRRGRTRRRPSR